GAVRRSYQERVAVRSREPVRFAAARELTDRRCAIVLPDPRARLRDWRRRIGRERAADLAAAADQRGQLRERRLERRARAIHHCAPPSLRAALKGARGFSRAALTRAAPACCISSAI